MSDPLISCLVVTLPTLERLAHLERSIGDWCRQTYERREMVVLLEPGSAEYDIAARRMFDRLGRSDIRVVKVAGGQTLGALRQFSLTQAAGVVTCQWDDDDRHHPERLARQWAAMRAAGAEAVLFEEALHYFAATRRLYWTNWRATDAKGIPGTLMCDADAPIAYPARGPEAARGEDSSVARQLQARGRLALLAGAPHLYVYVSHGINTWPDAHHRMLADRLAVSRGVLLRQEARLREGLAAFDWGDGPVAVCGSNGEAFIIGG